MADHRPDDHQAVRSSHRLDAIPTHDRLVSVLEDIAARPVDGPDPDFVARLEQHLLDGTAVVTPIGDHGRPQGRRTRSARAVAVVAFMATMAAGSIAAALVAHHDGVHEIVTPAAPDETHVSTLVEAMPTTISPTGASGQEPSAPTVFAAAPTPTSSVASTLESRAIESATTRPSSERTATSVVTLPKPNIESTTPASPSTSEPTPTPTSGDGPGAPQTLTIFCTSTASAISCSWSATSSEALAAYRVLRTAPGESRGRVFTPEPGSRSYTDATVVIGTSYGYRVQAIDAAGSVIEQSPLTTATPS